MTYQSAVQTNSTSSVEFGRETVRLRRRMWLFLWIFTGIIGLFILRLMWLQLGEPTSPLEKRSFLELSVRQRMERLVIDHGRGEFVDRHGQSFMGQRQQALAFFPVQYQTFLAQKNGSDSDEVHSHIAEVLGISTDEWKNWTKRRMGPEIWKRERPYDPPHSLQSAQIQKLHKMKIPGVYVVEWKSRYPEPYLAGHLLGFTAEQPKRLAADYQKMLSEQRLHWNSPLGASGLEHSLDRILVGLEETYLFHWLDGKNRPLGKGLRKYEPASSFYPLQVVTTLDYTIQAEVERLMDHMGMNGGSVVVLDARNADVLAMASRPAYHPGQWGRSPKAMQSWSNHALKAITPGSVYKIVSAAAALEEGIEDHHTFFAKNIPFTKGSTYYCSGTYERYGLTCWKQGGHGKLSLLEAFSQSCNVTFAEIGEQLTGEQIQSAAEKLGLLSSVGWRREEAAAKFSLLPEEETGQLFKAGDNGSDGGVRAQSAIGQRDVKMTPLQAANLVVTILNDGVVKQPRVVSRVQYRNGGKLMSFPEQVLNRRKDSISPSTARWLRKAMGEVVNSGTGQMVASSTWELAGKSGTAETGLSINGVPTDHQWFVGYGPAASPRFAVAVVWENVPENNEHLATKLFGDVMNFLATIDLEKHSVVK